MTRVGKDQYQAWIDGWLMCGEMLKFLPPLQHLIMQGTIGWISISNHVVGIHAACLPLLNQALGLTIKIANIDPFRLLNSIHQIDIFVPRTNCFIISANPCSAGVTLDL